MLAGPHIMNIAVKVFSLIRKETDPLSPYDLDLKTEARTRVGHMMQNIFIKKTTLYQNEISFIDLLLPFS